MPNLLQELQNNDAVLLMYLAGELPDEDRAEVEQMLAGDASFRAELEEVRGLQAKSHETLARLDALARLPVKQDAAIRQVSRLMNRWNVERVSNIAVPEPVKSLRFPWWSYPLSTAAAVMLAFLVWWGNKTDIPGNTMFAMQPDEVTPISPDVSVDPADGMAAFELADQLVFSFDVSDRILDNAGETILLADAERQLSALATPLDEVFSLNVSESNQ